MINKILALSLFITLFACSGSDDQITTTETYQMSLDNNNYDASNLFFIINNDYDHPILTCYSFTVRTGDIIKIVGETNIISNDVFVTAVLKKDTQIVRNIQLTRSTSYLNHPLSVHGLCDSPNSSFAASDVRLWKDGTGAISFTIE